MKRLPHALSALMLCFVVGMGLAHAETLTGKAGEVFDGDTFVLELENDRDSPRIRAWGIDAPESSQPYGEQSGQALRRALGADELRVDVVDRDQYGRLVGRVWVNDQSVNYWMVKAGHAWVYTRYNHDVRYVVAQRRAQNQRWGLWVLPADQRVRPSNYRRSQ